VKAHGSAEGAKSFEVTAEKSFNPAELVTFRPAAIDEFGAAVNGKVAALAKVGIERALRSLRLEIVVENNSGSLPYLSPGKNTVAVSVADPAALGDNRLVVTYAYAPGYRNVSYEQLCAEGKRIAAQVGAVWAETPTVVQKAFAAKDLPAAFDIDIPTPKEKYPVYPRMLFVRRVVISPSAKPQPLPENAQAPKMGPGDELKTLPDPFLVGARLPVR